ncbi:MAG: two-component regulator propeller domain-containing protein [bacterium]
MPQDTVRAIRQTKDGYLWLGTNAGLGALVMLAAHPMR